MYIPFEACCDCSKLIIQAGITEVVYKNHYQSKDPLVSNMIGLHMMLRAGVAVRQWNGPTHILDLKTEKITPPYGDASIIVNE